MCDGDNRLKAGGGHGSLTEGKGEPTPETEPIFLAGENWRVLKITILIARHTIHHGFGHASTVHHGHGGGGVLIIADAFQVNFVSIRKPLAPGIQQTWF